MAEQTKSPLEIMLDAARQAELEALDRKQKGLPDPVDLLTGNPPKRKKGRPDFHGLKVIRSGKK